MSIEQTLERIAFALEQLAGSAPPAQIAPATPAEPAPKPKKAPKTVVPPVVVEEAETATDAAPAATKAITTEDVRTAIVAGIKANLRPQVKAIVDSYGAKDANGVKPSDLQGIYDELTALTALAA